MSEHPEEGVNRATQKMLGRTASPAGASGDHSGPAYVPVTLGYEGGIHRLAGYNYRTCT